LHQAVAAANDPLFFPVADDDNGLGPDDNEGDIDVVGGEVMGDGAMEIPQEDTSMAEMFMMFPHESALVLRRGTELGAFCSTVFILLCFDFFFFYGRHFSRQSESLPILSSSFNTS